MAVTRARRQVMVFTSFDPIDVDLSRTRSTGLAHLRAYLEMADRGPGSDGASGTSHGDRSTNPVQESIAATLRSRGYEVQTNYGLSEFVLDIVVREPASDRWQVRSCSTGLDGRLAPPCPTAT